MQRIKTITLSPLLSFCGVVTLACSPVRIWAAATGSLSGTLKDPSGAVVPGAHIRLVNTALRSEYEAVSNGLGFDSFPSLQVGHYDLMIAANGFKAEKKNDLIMDTDAVLKLDAVLALGRRSAPCGKKVELFGRITPVANRLIKPRTLASNSIP